jgi:Rab GDP dissociation inhibitor
VQQYDEANPNTYKNYNLLVMTMDQLYEKYGLSEETIEFIGHAVALYPDVAYRKRPALPTVKRLALYYQSLTRFAGLKSPYIYPLYGLGELPQVHATAPSCAGSLFWLLPGRLVFVFCSRCC